MSAADLKKFNLLDFPTVIYGLVSIINLLGIKKGKLCLNADLVIGYVLRKNREMKRDPAIVNENPKLTPPNLCIVPMAPVPPSR